LTSNKVTGVMSDDVSISCFLPEVGMHN